MLKNAQIVSSFMIINVNYYQILRLTKNKK